MITPKRGWTSKGLSIIESGDSSYWSTSDAALILGDGLRTDQVRSLIRLAGISPAGKRHGPSRRGGRYIRVYAAIDIIKAYEAISDSVRDSSQGASSPPGITPGFTAADGSDGDTDGADGGDDKSLEMLGDTETGE